MRLTVTIEGQIASGKSLFLAEMKRWLEYTLKDERYFKASDIQREALPLKETLTATIEMR